MSSPPFVQPDTAGPGSSPIDSTTPRLSNSFERSQLPLGVPPGMPDVAGLHVSCSHILYPLRPKLVVRRHQTIRTGLRAVRSSSRATSLHSIKHRPSHGETGDWPTEE